MAVLGSMTIEVDNKLQFPVLGTNHYLNFLIDSRSPLTYIFDNDLRNAY